MLGRAMKLIATLFALVLALPTSAQKTAAREPIALARIGDGKPVCGLGKGFHAGRRAELRERAGKELLVFRGLAGTRGNLAFRQDKNFWYLTGVESPEAALVLDGKGDKEILFLPEENKRAESWNGEIWDAKDEWVKELTGFEQVRPTGELANTLKELVKEGSTVWIAKMPWVALSGCRDRAEPFDQRVIRDPFDGRKSREDKLEEQLVDKFKCEVKGLDAVLDGLRLVKTQEEITALRRAGRAGASAMVEAMRSTAPGVGEWEIAGVMSFIHQREGAAWKVAGYFIR